MTARTTALLSVLKGINDDRLKLFLTLITVKDMQRNNGMSVANGKYIAFIDADDTIEECMLEKCMKKKKAEKGKCGYGAV